VIFHDAHERARRTRLGQETMIGSSKPKHPESGIQVQVSSVCVADECAPDINAGSLRRVLGVPLLTELEMRLKAAELPIRARLARKTTIDV
jgi:hypothetical protein